jgi:hypothetical protein
VFQGARIGVTTQMKKNVVSFLMRVHNFGHWTNLVMLVLLKLSLAYQLKVLFQALYRFYFIHLKNSLNFKACVMCLHKRETNC